MDLESRAGEASKVAESDLGLVEKRARFRADLRVEIEHGFVVLRTATQVKPLHECVPIVDLESRSQC